MDDIFVHYIDMPTTIAETVTENADGSYSIFLNSRMSQDRLIKAYEHALEHIRRDDFHSTKDIQQIEAEAHGFEPPASLPTLRHNRKARKKKRSNKRTEFILRHFGKEYFEMQAEKRFLEPE